MAPEVDLRAHIRGLELRLLEPRVRRSPAEMAPLLADDFLEFGSSGRTFDKARVIASLQEEPDLRFSLSAFELTQLAPGIVLATYRVVARRGEEAEQSSLRSSIWVLRDGRWQIRFHQGTPTSELAQESSP